MLGWTGIDGLYSHLRVCWDRGVINLAPDLFSIPPSISPLLQLDTEYRKKWDALVIKLEVVDRDTNTGSEVVHWATHFPVSFCYVTTSFTTHK